MPHLRCPQLDILTNRLIEAYRQMVGTDISSMWSHGGSGLALSVTQLQAAIREHKLVCVLCMRIQSARNVQPMRLPHTA
jgi:hypothetical protein